MMAATKIGVKLLIPHRSGCLMVGERHVFVMPDDRPYEFGRDRAGRAGGGSLWMRFRCNDPDCEAIAIVRWDRTSSLIDDALEGSDAAA